MNTVALTISCESCAVRLVKWLEDHKEEIDNFLKGDLRDSDVIWEHQIGKIGILKVTYKKPEIADVQVYGESVL